MPPVDMLDPPSMKFINSLRNSYREAASLASRTVEAFETVSPGPQM